MIGIGMPMSQSSMERMFVFPRLVLGCLTALAQESSLAPQWAMRTRFFAASNLRFIWMRCFSLKPARTSAQILRSSSST